MENILNEKDYFCNIREVITIQLLEKAKTIGLIDETIAKQIIKELAKVEVIDYASC